jgi:hypothetical protein
MRRCLLLFPLLLISGGCTGMLWQNTDWDCKPDSTPNLRVFDAASQKDLLVVYNEFSERTKTIHTRAYLLNKNQNNVVLQKHPHFVSTNLAGNLPPVPVFQTPPIITSLSQPLYVVAPTNAVGFMVYSNQTSIGSFDLPWYSDRTGQIERIALSPVAITVDVVIVGAAIYFVILNQPCQ